MFSTCLRQLRFISLQTRSDVADPACSSHTGMVWRSSAWTSSHLLRPSPVLC